MSVKLLTEHDLEFLSLKGDCTGSFDSTLVIMPHCLKSHVTAHIIIDTIITIILYIRCCYDERTFQVFVNTVLDLVGRAPQY